MGAGAGSYFAAVPASPLLTAARLHVAKTLAALDEQLAALDAAQAGETKSSAGDKFETSREMMQQERNRLEAQRAIAAEQRLQLQLAERAPFGKTVGLGTTVTLADGNRYLLAAAVGKLRLPDGTAAYAISRESPLAQALWGRGEGDEVAFRGRRLLLTKVT